MVTYNSSLRRDRMAEVIDHIDQGAAVSRLQIGDGNASASPPTLGTLLVAVDLQDPSFTQTTDGRIELAAPATGLSGIAGAGGTASSANIIDGSGTVVVSGLRVGIAAPAEIILNAAQISSGQTVTISTGSITHANNT